MGAATVYASRISNVAHDLGTRARQRPAVSYADHQDRHRAQRDRERIRRGLFALRSFQSPPRAYGALVPVCNGLVGGEAWCHSSSILIAAVLWRQRHRPTAKRLFVATLPPASEQSRRARYDDDD